MKRIRWWLKPGHHTTPAMVYQPCVYQRCYRVEVPNGLLMFPKPLTDAAVAELRRRWNEERISK